AQDEADGLCVHHSKIGRPMSALGQKPTCAPQKVMSALPPKADMCGANEHVCFEPITDIGRQFVRYRMVKGCYRRGSSTRTKQTVPNIQPSTPRGCCLLASGLVQYAAIQADCWPSGNVG